MSQGSKRVTVRLGDDAIEQIREVCEQLNDRPQASRTWTLTEFIVQAVVEKLNKIERGRGKSDRFQLEKVDDFDPRVWFDEGE
jgi:hypothetical protein